MPKHTLQIGRTERNKAKYCSDGPISNKTKRAILNKPNKVDPKQKQQAGLDDY